MHQSLAVGLDILQDQMFGRANIVWKQHFHNFLRQNYEKSHKFQWSSKISLTYDTIESDLSRNTATLFLLGMRKYCMIHNKNWMEVLLLFLTNIQRLCSPKITVIYLASTLMVLACNLESCRRPRVCDTDHHRPVGHFTSLFRIVEVTYILQ